jgi:hypothetical protein
MSLKPVAFLTEIFDISKTSNQKYNNCSSAMPGMYFCSSSASTSGACIHEDGGDLAVFEENSEVRFSHDIDAIF